MLLDSRKWSQKFPLQCATMLVQAAQDTQMAKFTKISQNLRITLTVSDQQVARVREPVSI